MRCIKKEVEETGHVIVQSQNFEKELLYTSFQNIAHKHRKYPIAYFMEKFLLRDIKRYKSKYDRFMKKEKSGFAIDLFESKYHDVTLVKTSIESLESYMKESRALFVNKIIKRLCFVIFGLPPIVGILGLTGVYISLVVRGFPVMRMTPIA